MGKALISTIYSETAEKVELCLFDEPSSKTERERIPLKEVTGHAWYCYPPGIGPGQPYGYRVHGQYEPENRLRFNAAKLLINPYARAIAGVMQSHYVNRLGAYLHQKGITKETRAYVSAEMERIYNSIETLNKLDSKAHDVITIHDARTAAIGTYIILGELVTRTNMKPITEYRIPSLLV